MAAPSPIRELDAAAGAAKTFRLTTAFDLSNGETLHALVSLYRIDGASNWGMELAEGTAQHSVDRYIPVSGVADALRQVVADYPTARLLPETIRVAIQEGPATASALQPVAVQAWHEAYGLPVPTLEELVARRKASKAAKKAAADLVARLRSDPDGAFRDIPPEERCKADLRRADLAGCCLDGVDFGGANLEGADLSGASLVKAVVHGGRAAPGRLKGVKLVGADLTEAWLGNCRGADADFSRATLKGAYLAHSHFPRARFVGADLTDASLFRSDLRGADFTDAVLTRATLLAGCQFDEHTRWPKRFRRPAGLVWKGTGPDPRQSPKRRGAAGPKPTDADGFLDRLRTAADPARLDRAMAMLRADRFRLFARVTDDGLVGVVKSQSDPDLVYSCRLADDGAYACCTQNLNICGGLRGAPCKHLLVLVVGLAQAGELDPGTAHDWIQASRGRKPALDKDAMAETFLQYKGAEAGEVDWRPTETIPEDFYAM